MYVEDKLVSVIIPIYNAENTLAGIVNCMKSQSYQNWELILIDDGSTDNSLTLCQQFSVSDDRISYFHQNNQGVSAARNKGLQMLRGNYVTFLDADDLIDDNYIETLLDTCVNADIAVCDVVIMKDGREEYRFSVPNSANKLLSQTEALNYLLTRRGINSGPVAKMYRRNVISNIKFPSIAYYEDIIFVKDAFSRANRVCVTDRTAYYYIQNSSGAMANISAKNYKDIICATDNLLSFIRNRKNLSSECFYITISHLLQYAFEEISKDNYNKTFIAGVKSIIKRYAYDLMICKAFPVKEKIVFLLFMNGVSYKNGKVKWIR